MRAHAADTVPTERLTRLLSTDYRANLVPFRCDPFGSALPIQVNGPDLGLLQQYQLGRYLPPG